MNEKNLVFRLAERADLPSIVRLLADDERGRLRERVEDPLPEAYYAAFEKISRDVNNELIVAVLGKQVVGTLHLIFLRFIGFQGGLRAQIESVRVDRKHRKHGIGSEMLKWAIGRAKDRNAYMIQLTTHLSRKDAHRFYERLGFEGTHLGMKLSLK